MKNILVISSGWQQGCSTMPGVTIKGKQQFIRDVATFLKNVQEVENPRVDGHSEIGQAVSPDNENRFYAHANSTVRHL